MGAYGTLTGRLGRDPERSTMGQWDATRVSIATDSGWGDRKKTTWWRVTAFGKTGEALMRAKKGQMVSIAGEFFEETYLDQSGNERKSLNCTASHVDLLERKAGGPDTPTDTYSGVGASETQKTEYPSEPDVPF